MHAGVSRGLGRGTGGRRAVMARDLGEEVRIEVVRFRGRMEFDDAEDRAVGGRRNACLAGGGVGLARDIGGGRVREPEVENLDAQLGFAPGLGRDVFEPENRLAAGVVGRDHASDIISCRHTCFPPVVVATDVTSARARSRWRARGTYHGRAMFGQAPRNRGRMRTSHAGARALSAPIAVACAVRSWQGGFARTTRPDRLGREPDKKPRISPRNTLKAQMLRSGTIHAGVESPFAWWRL